MCPWEGGNWAQLAQELRQSQRGKEQGMSRGIPGLDPITRECSPAPQPLGNFI